MCGIAGIVSRKEPLQSGLIKAMLSSIRHRGPDDSGSYETRFTQTGMNRLAILDLQSTGLCPLIDTEHGDQPVVLVYNGEIYNHLELRGDLIRRGHTFRTTCDAEVLLRSYLEWGESCLDRFNGMFAFAIFDYSNNLLLAARDRAGEKPFYYYQDSDRFLFASEIKALLAQIPAPEIHLTDEFDAFEYMTGEETPFRGIRSLLPGHKLVLKGLQGGYRGVEISEYWNVLGHIRDVRPERAVDELEALLEDSVRIRLRSDVPWGLYLSGGLDSSLLAYLAKPPVCFSCHFDCGPKYDELRYARMVAEGIGSRHVVIQPSLQDFRDSFSKITYHLDTPVGSLSSFPLFMLAQEARKHVKIVLSGEGSDELFSGYVRYLILAHEQALYAIPGMENYKPLLDFYFGPPLDRFARILNRGRVSDENVKRLIAPHFSAFQDVTHGMGYTDFKMMLGTLLQMEDRASSAFGLENRSPFLDHRLIEFAFSIPGNLKIRGLTSKWILREVARRRLPKIIVERQDKMGLIPPINLWMSQTGKRGEFDREAYNKLCLEEWRQVFFGDKRPNPFS